MSEATITPSPPDRLQLGYRLSCGVAVIDVRGEVDLFSCGLLRDRLLVALTDDCQRGMVLNLAEMSFIDSTGIGVLLDIWRRAQARPGQLALAAPSSQARTVLETTHLNEVFAIYDAEDQAVKACCQPSGD
jgi:anti-sigma B factor antagonist